MKTWMWIIIILLLILVAYFGFLIYQASQDAKMQAVNNGLNDASAEPDATDLIFSAWKKLTTK